MQAQVFDLPLNLTVDLLKNWLLLKDVAALDKALCNRSCREGYLEVLKSDGFVLDSLPEDAELVPLMRWIEVHKIKVRRIDLRGLDTNSEPGLLASFMGSVGPAVEDLSADNSGDALVLICCLAMVLCTRLCILQLRDCGADNSAATISRLIAAKAPSLERLALEDGEISEALPERCAMEKLKYLSFKRFTAATPRLCAFVRNYSNLLYFYCDDLGRTDDVLNALAESCRSLQSLHYGNAASGSTAGLEAVLLACQDLHTIDFTTPFGFTNAHISTIVQHCGKLQALRIMLSPRGIDQECVAILIPRLPELRILHLIGMCCTSDAPIMLLTQHCGGLIDLGVRALSGTISEGALVALFRALSRLEDLNLSYAQCLSDAVLAAIGKNCPRLDTLDLYGAIALSEEGITEIAKGCAELEMIAYKPNEVGVVGETIFSGLARSVWKVLRPNLEFLTVDDTWTRWKDVRRDV
jgi:hypothetical protein